MNKLIIKGNNQFGNGGISSNSVALENIQENFNT